MVVMNNKEKEMRKLRDEIVEIIAGNLYFDIEREIESWSTDEVKRAIAYIDSDDFTDNNFFVEIYNLAEIVATDIQTQMNN